MKKFYLILGMVMLLALSACTSTELKNKSYIDEVDEIEFIEDSVLSDNILL